MACQMSFSGISNAEITQRFRVNASTVSRWRKFPIWIDFETECITTDKQAAVQEQLSYGAEIESPAQG